MKKLAIALALATALTTTANAAGSSNYTVVGIGIYSCGKLTVWRRQNNGMVAAVNTWIAGYISGARSLWAAVNGATYEPPNNDALYEWVANYCAVNPLATIENATNHLMAKIMVAPKKKPEAQGEHF